MTAIRVLNPAAFLLPDLSQLVLDALKTSPLVQDAEAALLELVEHLHDERLGVFAVREADRYVAAAIAENNTSAMSPVCLVLHFYNRGSAEARKSLIEAMAAFAREAGHSRIWGIDMNQRPGAFARLFKEAGPAESHGQLFSFDLSEGSV